MNCEVYSHCPRKSGCDTCKTDYKNYIKYCVENKLKPTTMKPERFSSFDVTPKGEEMTQTEQRDILTYVEAANILGVCVSSIKSTYIYDGRLERVKPGYVSRKSVEEYKRKRLKSLEKAAQKLKNQATVKQIKHIDEVENIKNAPDDTKVWVTLGALREAIKLAKEMGRKEAEAKLRKEYESRTLDKRQILELVAAS